MKLRGRRRCVECDEPWSYFETRSVTCPACGSVRSVGVDDERRLHTDTPVELDLSEARAGVDDRPLREIAADAEETTRSYVVSRGFVREGELLPIDDVFLAANELRYAAARIRRELGPSDDEERYFLELLADAPDGRRPDQVPPSLRAARGLGNADAVDAYRTDVLSWLDEHPDGAARETLERLRQHERRITALDGEVSPEVADHLVAVASDLTSYLRENDEGALARARNRLSNLD